MNRTPSPAVIESDIYVTEYLAAHSSAMRHHPTGAKPPGLPSAPSFHQPKGYWISDEKPLFFRAVSAHSCLRLIAAIIGTKSITDEAVTLSLLREGAPRANNNKASRSGFGTTIWRDQHRI